VAGIIKVEVTEKDKEELFRYIADIVMKCHEIAIKSTKDPIFVRCIRDELVMDMASFLLKSVVEMNQSEALELFSKLSEGDD
jgi:hypothetical protein